MGSSRDIEILGYIYSRAKGKGMDGKPTFYGHVRKPLDPLTYIVTHSFVNRRVLTNIAGCSRILQGVPEYCRAFQNIAGRTRILQGVPECCRVFEKIARYTRILQGVSVLWPQK